MRLAFSSSTDSSNNADLFGGSVAAPSKDAASSGMKPSASGSTYYKDEAARLRQEAAEMEVALREEARAKGVPEEMINKLIPLRQEKSKTAPKVAVAADGTTVVTEDVKGGSDGDVTTKKSSKEIRSKLGYLNAGDPVRITSELDRLKARGSLRIWNSKEDLPSSPASRTNTFDSVNNYQLKAKTNIDALQLKLDDVGYKYQNVLVIALVLGTVLGLGSSFIGGELGFVMGYLSALIPVTLVGIGSIAPALIFEIINRVKYIVDNEAKQRYIRQNAAKFLVGYVVGLPVSRFDAGSPSNTCDFFQIRPQVNANDIEENKKMYAKKSFSQYDIARASVVCTAASVAECIAYGSASGTAPADVNTLNELINAVQPTLEGEKVQNHVRWSALNAHAILTKYKIEFDQLVQAFERGLPLEECIALIEGDSDILTAVSV